VAGDALSVHFTAARATNGAALRGDDVAGLSGAWYCRLAIVDARIQARQGGHTFVAAVEDQHAARGDAAAAGGRRRRWRWRCADRGADSAISAVGSEFAQIVVGARPAVVAIAVA